MVRTMSEVIHVIRQLLKPHLKKLASFRQNTALEDVSGNGHSISSSLVKSPADTPEKEQDRWIQSREGRILPFIEVSGLLRIRVDIRLLHDSGHHEYFVGHAADHNRFAPAHQRRSPRAFQRTAERINGGRPQLQTAHGLHGSINILSFWQAQVPAMVYQPWSWALARRSSRARAGAGRRTEKTLNFTSGRDDSR